MTHPAYLVAGVIALLAAMSIAFYLRRSLLKSEDSLGTSPNANAR